MTTPLYHPAQTVGRDSEAPLARTYASSTIAQAGALIAAACGVAAMLGWSLNLPLLSSPDPRWVPMAPSTALLFALFGGALFFCSSAPQSKALRRAGIGIGSVGGLLGLLLLVLALQDIRLETERLGLVIAGTVDGIPIGHMSPVAALCFALAGLSLVASLVSPRTWPAGAVTAFWLGCSVTALALFFLLAYLFGEPLLYSGDFIPLALTTSLAFVALGAALMVFAGSRAWPFQRDDDVVVLRTARMFLALFGVFATSLVAAGYLYTINHQDQYRQEAGQMLSAIAELKADDLVRWRAERVSDASSQFRTKMFSALVGRVLGGQADAPAQLQDWFEQYRKTRHFDQIVLTDARGVTRMTVPINALPLGLSERADATAPVFEPTLVDFHRNKKDGPPRLTVVVPIADAQYESQLLGLIYLGIDPNEQLYPIIQRWPTRSRTAETMLVRRDGDAVLYLNELLHQKHTALSLRIPLDRTDVPAIKAVLGQEGVVEGLDYRGKPVIAGVRRVSDSPWFLIARMDTAEALAPAYERLWLLTGLIAALLLAAAGATGFVWRHQHVRNYREKYRSAGALAASQARHRAVTENANDAIINANANGAIVSWNPAAARIFGYAEAEVLGQSLTQLMPQRYRERHQSGMRKVIAGENSQAIFRTVELHGLTKAGCEFPLELSLSRWESSEGVFFTGIIRDITVRRHAENALRRRTVLYETLSRISATIMRNTSREELLPQICRDAVEHGCLRFAWIGMVSPADERVCAVAQYGEDAGYVSAVCAAADASQRNRDDPLYRAVDCGARVVVNDVLPDPPRAAWREAARRAGVRTAAAFPLWEGGAVVGAMCLYSSEAEFFGEELLPVLDQMAMDISFALDNYLREAAREQADAGRRAIIDGSMDAVITVDKDNRIVVFNMMAEKLFLCSAAEAIGQNLDRFIPARFRDAHAAHMREFRLSGATARAMGKFGEVTALRSDGTEFPIEAAISHTARGTLQFLTVTIRDTSERKQAEATRNSLEAQLRESQKMEAIGTLAAGIAHDFNNALATILGNTELACRDVGTNSVALESLAEIRKAGTRVRDLVQQILTFSRRQPTIRQPILLAPIVEQSARLLRATVTTRLALEVCCDPDTPIVLADASQIEQILINLVTNAMQALRGGPGRIAIGLEAHCVGETKNAGSDHRSEVERVTLVAGHYARLQVRDNGSGMDEATRARIFEPFFTTKAVNEGTGLGLSVVHGIVRTHGGTILVESRPDQGTTVSIYLPAAKVQAGAVASGPEAATANATTSEMGRGQRILYLDDDESLVLLTKRLLERYGFRVSGYCEQSEALAALRADPAAFDLVVSDYNMLGMSGLDVARAVREIRADLPVVIASGFIDETLREGAAEAGVRELIYKASVVEDLCTAVARFANAPGGNDSSI